jgi:alanine racemase
VRPSYVEVDLGAIRHNVARFVELAAPAEVCVVVKADAYGHGDVPVSEAALQAGAGSLAVALVEEGIRLREAGLESPILLLSEPPIEDIPELLAWNLTPTVYTHVFLEELSTKFSGSDPIPIHLKVDTGMNRVGADPAVALEIAERLARGEFPVSLEGLWTHFSVADSDRDFTSRQIEVFDEVKEKVLDLGLQPTKIHLANTPGTLFFPEAHGTMVRVGLGVYGLNPTPDTVAGLSPAMRVVSHVSHVWRHPAGTRPSYGRVKALLNDSTVATVPIGYADGFPRIISEKVEVLIGGQRYPLAGTVTMDQILVDVGDDSVVVGDEVVLIGRQGAVEINATDWANLAGTINYEIVCGFGPRLPRRYIQ